MVLALLAAALPGVLLAGCSSGPEQPARGSTSEPTRQVSQAPAAHDPAKLGMPESKPNSIAIPRIGAKSSLVPLGLRGDGSVEVPPVSEPMQAGWYRNGPTPGELGPAVVLGHVDGNHKQGIFARLDELAAGDKVTINRQDGSTARFRVREVDKVPKQRFPTESVYGNTEKPELRLITCGGSFDYAEHSYRDNVIVYAELV